MGPLGATPNHARIGESSERDWPHQEASLSRNLLSAAAFSAFAGGIGDAYGLDPFAEIGAGAVASARSIPSRHTTDDGIAEILNEMPRHSARVNVFLHRPE